MLDAKSNVVFHAYAQVEAVLDESNAQLLAQCTFESNSIYVYNNKVNRNRIVASWDGRGRVPHYKIFKPGDDTAWLRAVETPPISDQLQAMVSAGAAGAAEHAGADEQTRRRAGQRGQRDVESEHDHHRGAAGDHEPCRSSPRNCASRAAR